MNIRWLSPQDPDKTEIGRYSQALLPHLHKAFSLHVVTDSITTHQDFSPDKSVTGMEPMNIYNLGNSYMHCGILALAMEQPGLIILHDVSLLELGLAYARETGKLDLSEMVGSEYGSSAAWAFDRLYGGENYEWRGDTQEQYDEFVTASPLFETFTAKANGIVVHSDYALEKVKGKFTGPLIRLDLPYELRQVKLASRRIDPPLDIVFCGHAGPNRRLRQFIQAWATISQPRYFRLNLYGNIDKADEILDLAESVGLSGLINVIGFVSDEELDLALSRTHFALNLRNPTMGEASASQLRYWSHAIPSIVSDLGWYGELPDDVVIKVAPETEHKDIATALEAIISGSRAHLDCGKKGYKYLCEQHSVERYVQQLAGFVSDLAEARFVASIFDDGLVRIMESMCDDVNDSSMFEGTLASLSGMVEGLEKVQLK